MQIINHTARIPCCVVMIKYRYTCTHSMGSLPWVHPQHIPWGRGRGTPYTHNLTTHHTSAPTNCPHTHHTSPLTTPPQWPHPPLTTPPHFPRPTDPPPTHWRVIASGLSSKKDGVLTFSEVWWPGHAYGASHIHEWHNYCVLGHGYKGWP